MACSRVNFTYFIMTLWCSRDFSSRSDHKGDLGRMQYPSNAAGRFLKISFKYYCIFIGF